MDGPKAYLNTLRGTYRGKLMIKLIRVQPKNKFSNEAKYWMIGDRFELIVSVGTERCSIFIEDTMNKIHSSKLTQKICNELQLLTRPDFKIIPSIDTCGIGIPAEKHDEIFKLIEEYLLRLSQDKKSI